MRELIARITGFGDERLGFLARIQYLERLLDHSHDRAVAMQKRIDSLEGGHAAMKAAIREALEKGIG